MLAGSKQSLYDEMTNKQWVQGMLFCILEETDAEIWSQILSYFAILIWNAIELSLGSGRSAHAVVLQEMEKGKLSWDNSDQVEKFKTRQPQHMLTSVKTAHSTVNQACISTTRANVKRIMTIQIMVFFIIIAVHTVSRRHPSIIYTLIIMVTTKL